MSRPGFRARARESGFSVKFIDCHYCDEDCLASGCLWQQRADAERRKCDGDGEPWNLDAAPDAERVIQAPITTPEDRAFLARVRRNAVVLAVTGIGALAALLELFGAPPLRH